MKHSDEIIDENEKFPIKKQRDPYHFAFSNNNSCVRDGNFLK